MNSPIIVNAEVANAIERHLPVVALETTIITHGLPYPQNLETARLLEDTIRAAGAVPATIGMLAGEARVGLNKNDLESLTRQRGEKIQRRSLPWAAARRISGGTTVSATMSIAHMVGIRVFVTGGIGGVHRGVETSGDVSEDLAELARTPLAVVSAGAKAILDLPRTLEMLETLGVMVVGYQTKEFPAFYTRHSGLFIPSLNIEEIASLLYATWQEWQYKSSVLVCNPPPPDNELPAGYVEELIAQAIAAAHEEQIKGKDLTPFLLAYLEKSSRGKTVATNIALVNANARLAAEVAKAYQQLLGTKSC
jgi:pseudouridine-5'-phosphate glycosidase